MKFELYAIKDELSEFAAPIPIPDEPQARRYFRETVKATPMMANNPEDFSIWKVGEYDTENGSLAGIRPLLIERGQRRPNDNEK